ncbi:hypothetical protein C8Q74DRAFT_5329 [Fomes fomentarius]|nr:hypothetical protein C8Q74DRAFT_5329 [Fomes fomentarius]
MFDPPFTRANRSLVQDALVALLHDATILPEGGILGFGSQHLYPFPRTWRNGDGRPARQPAGWLAQGRRLGAVSVYAACKALGLTRLLRLVWSEHGNINEIDHLRRDGGPRCGAGLGRGLSRFAKVAGMSSEAKGSRTVVPIA